jgi:A/G-specific adenine glycosylase
MAIMLQNRIIANWSRYKRDFLWRHNPNPYKIMIAEFLLQRTKADQVEPVYKKFLMQYPTISHLSKSKSKSVAKYTNSLGLHGRYKKIMASAKYVENELSGNFPNTQKEMLKIPGVGDYVTGAILAVCNNSADYVIDSNIARFINRYYSLGLKGEIRRKKIIIEKAKKLFKTKNQRDLLFALLDYTALICKPIKPDCEKCIFKKCKTSCSKS